MRTWIKSLIMLMRLMWLCGLGLGIWIVTGHGVSMLAAHIGVGFGIVVLMLLLLISAALHGVGIVKPAITFVVAIALPLVGFGQLAWHSSSLWMLQLFHVLIAAAALGLAEMLSAAILRAAPKS